MSTSLLYHAFGLVGYRYLKTEYSDGIVSFSIEKKPDKLSCADCDSKKVIRCGFVMWAIKTLPIGRKQVLFVVKIQRVECTDCGAVKQEKLNFAEPKKTYTRAFERYVLELSKLWKIRFPIRHGLDL